MIAQAPPLVPRGLLNRVSVRAFNELWFRKAPKRRRDELQTIPTFFHPLDMVGGWNRVYGPGGFLQWQFVVPFGAEATLRRDRRRAQPGRLPRRSSPCSRPSARPTPGRCRSRRRGWTLALDIPTSVPGLAGLLDRLDDRVADAGGRVYLAKDGRLRPELVPVMYPRLDEWRVVRERVDPDRRLTSDLARRLGL